ncbi:MAG: SufS family cysteine desulfurase [Saprospiraceae bacterium]
MNTPDTSKMGSQNMGWDTVPEGLLGVDVISQLANRIYQEGILDSPAEATPSHESSNLLPGSEMMSDNPVGNIKDVSSHSPTGSLSSRQQEAAQAERLIYKPEVSENSQPPRHSIPNEQDFYFLQPATNAIQTAPEANTEQPASPIPVGDMFDLSGERCLIAPILPKIVGPEISEKMIALAGRPIDNMESAAQVLDEVQARDGIGPIPFFSGGQQEAQIPADRPSDSDVNQLYFQQLAGQPFSEQGLYFLNEPPLERKPDAHGEQAAAPDQKPERDWSDYRMFSAESVRKDFPALHQNVNGKPLVWLDNAATTHKPQQVIDTLSRFYERDNSNIHRAAHTLSARATDAYENAREKIRQFIGAGSKDEIIFVRGTTEGINLIANTFGRQRIGPGDEIILSELEHHANIVPWQMLAQEKGARLRVIPINQRGDIMLEDYEQLFNQRTRIVALTQVSNALGTVVPVQEMIATAHRFGVPVLIDGAQSVQHMAVNVQAMDADFFVFSGHKLFAPTGIGAVYGKMEHLEKMPPWQGGGNMIDRVTFEETTYNGVPAKFEAGTPSIADAIGLGAAIDYVRKIGLENIHRYETELMEYMVHALTGIRGLHIIGNPTHRAGALSFVMENISTITIGQLLDKEGIAVRSGHHCAQPALRHFGLESSVRPSLAFYNTKEDVDRLRAALLKIA